MSNPEFNQQKQKCEQLAALHQRGRPFVIPNPWDAGSARLLQGMGFEALATTSAGLAYTLAKSDGDITLEEKLAHCRALATVTSIPISADFEDGFADDPASVAENVLSIARTGIAGCSVEDFSRGSRTLYDFNLAVERVQAAAESIADLGMPFQITARAENHLRGVTDLDDTIKRLQAYAAAGADVLYAPGLDSLDQVREVTSAVGKPVNVLAVFFKGATLDDFAAAGAQRISLGSALAWATVAPLLNAGREMLEQGTFDWTANMASARDVQALLA